MCAVLTLTLCTASSFSARHPKPALIGLHEPGFAVQPQLCYGLSDNFPTPDTLLHPFPDIPTLHKHLHDRLKRKETACLLNGNSCDAFLPDADFSNCGLGSDVVDVPEPASISLLLIGALMLYRKPRSCYSG